MCIDKYMYVCLFGSPKSPYIVHMPYRYIRMCHKDVYPGQGQHGLTICNWQCTNWLKSPLPYRGKHQVFFTLQSLMSSLTAPHAKTGCMQWIWGNWLISFHDNDPGLTGASVGTLSVTGRWTKGRRELQSCRDRSRPRPKRWELLVFHFPWEHCNRQIWRSLSGFKIYRSIRYSCKACIPGFLIFLVYCTAYLCHTLDT